MKKILIIILISLKGYGCHCPIKKLAVWQKDEISNSECIFIGEIIEISKKDLTFKIRVTESLDGDDKIGNIYLGKNWKSCGPYIDKKGKWIIYGTMENDFLRLNMCGISRNFDSPIVDYLAPPPEIYNGGLTQNQKDDYFKKLMIRNKKLAQENLEKEIIELRHLRDNASR